MEENNNWNNNSRAAASRAKRGGGSSTTRNGSHRTRTSRLNPGTNLGRSPTYLDDVTLNAMITSGMMEALGPVHFAQFRVPLREANDHHPNEVGGAHFDYRFTLIPNNPSVPSTSNPGKGKEDISKLKSDVKDSLSRLLQDEEIPRKDPRFLLPTLSMEEVEREDIRTKRQETIMQWFDRAVEKELSKRRISASAENLPYFSENVKQLPKHLKYPQSILDKMAEASASQVEITGNLAMEPDTELREVVEKLAKAEAMCAFAGAVRAAEAAAEAAPPGLAEEAAQASARIFESDISGSEFREDVQGVRPMEVIGYIGITKPRNPVKSGLK